MHPAYWLRAASRPLAFVPAAIAALAFTAPAARAQVLAQFYAPFDGDTTGGRHPDPTQPYPYGRLVCTTTIGDASGFNFDFLSSTTRTILQSACGTSVADAYLQHFFGARFTGFLIAPSTGTYNPVFDSDDGNWLTINGNFVGGNWGAQVGGPGGVPVTLNAGVNPYVFDYYENSYGGAHATLELPSGLQTIPPGSTLPEPATWMLLGVGLLGVAGVRRLTRATT